MSVPDQLPVIVLFALMVSLFIDVLALPLRAAGRRGYTSGFKVVKNYLSNLLGFVFLCVCVPGAMLSLMVCFLRSWSDNQVVFAILLLFLAGAVVGLFLSSENVETRRSQA